MKKLLIFTALLSLNVGSSQGSAASSDEEGRRIRALTHEISDLKKLTASIYAVNPAKKIKFVDDNGYLTEKAYDFVGDLHQFLTVRLGSEIRAIQDEKEKAKLEKSFSDAL